MKHIVARIAVAALCLTAMVACDNMGEADNSLSEVKTLIEPADGKTLALETSEAAAIYFEWEYVQGVGTPVYQVAFDNAAGDFTNPIFLVNADNNGLKNSVTITHKQINRIASMAGILPSDVGTLKWTVLACKGTTTLKAKSAHNLTVTRLGGFEEIPVDVYVTGQGSEAGEDGQTKAHKMKATAGGEFEAYTYLKAGKPFYFLEGKENADVPRKFYTEAGLVKEDGTTTVTTDGIYRVTLDFNIGACTYTLVERISFYFSPGDEHYLFDLPYVGYGVFKAEKQTVTFHQESWGRDERYKFRMFVRENAGAADLKELEWGTLNGTDSRPNATSPEDYYYIKLLTNLSQWDNKWKLMGDFDGVPADYTIYLQADKPYTHSITK